jgi:hypothetical protein
MASCFCYSISDKVYKTEFFTIKWVLYNVNSNVDAFDK